MVDFVFFIEVGRTNVMALVPVNVDKSAIVSLSTYDLLLGDPKALTVSVVCVGHLEDLCGFLGADR